MADSSVNPSRSALPASSADEAQNPRQPFVPPTVQDLGGLTSLTLLGGSL